MGIFSGLNDWFQKEADDLEKKRKQKLLDINNALLGAKDKVVKKVQESQSPQFQQRVADIMAPQAYEQPSPFHELAQKYVIGPIQSVTSKISDVGNTIGKKVHPAFPESMQGLSPELLAFKLPKLATDTLFGNPEYRKEVFRIQKEGTTEERQNLARSIDEQRKLGMMFSTTAPGKLKITPDVAQKILQVGKNFNEEIVKKAYRNLAKQEFPRTVTEMASKYKTTAAKIVNEARDVLLSEAQRVAKPILEKAPGLLQGEVQMPNVAQPVVTKPKVYGLGEPKEGVYIRFGRPPKEGSGIGKAFGGGMEKGVSTYAAYYDPISKKYIIGLNPGEGGDVTLDAFKGTNRKAYIIEGKDLSSVGTDSEHLLDPKTTRIVKEVPLSDITDYNLESTFDGKELPTGARPVIQEMLSIQEQSTDYLKDKLSKMEDPDLGEGLLISRELKKRGEIISEPSAVSEKAPRTTLRNVEKQFTQEEFRNNLAQADSPDDMAARIKIMQQDLDKPEVSRDSAKLKDIRAMAVKEMANLTGVDSRGADFKTSYAVMMMANNDPEIEQAFSALEDFVIDIDERLGTGQYKKDMGIVQRDLSLPSEGKMYIPYGKYSTHGTENREWVQENIPLMYMGNKRGMVGYILDTLGIQQRNLGSITKEDVAHLGEIKNVTDLFGGSGLLSNLSKRFFPDAKITYNEYDPNVLKAIENVQKDPTKVNRFISEIATWLDRNPGSDWLAHFSTVYKGNKDFMTAARLLDAAGGRTAEITPLKIRALLKAVPNYAKTFKGINTTNNDALKVMDEMAKIGSSKDMLWIDPPYIWSGGYKVGSEMEHAAGFTKLLDKLDALNKRGVKFVFFNNDPEVQLAKAGKESAHIENILGKINQLSEQGMTVIRGIDPVGAADRREIMITNLDYGVKNGRLLNLKEVQKAIESLRDDPAAAPREILKMYRDIRGTSKYAPEGAQIKPGQIRRIRALKKNLRIKNREMEPLLDELLGDTSFAKMTQIDGDKMIEWLQPRNWDIIENKIGLTRDMLAKDKQAAIIGERFSFKDPELESKYGALTGLNKTLDEVENITNMITNLPRPVPIASVLREVIGGATGRFISEDQATKILGIKATFHTPLRAIIRAATNHTNRMQKALESALADLTEEERKQVVFLQAGAKKEIQGVISAKATRVANYIQEVAEANITLINRLRAAAGQKPLVSRKPYIPYIIDENLAQAADLSDRNKFWEMRTKTPKDFVAGLFTHDPQRIVDVWSQSTGSWLKKNMFRALLSDRMDDIYKVSNSASIYAREVVDMDIYDMLPDGEKLYRSVGRAINRGIGSIFPKRIPVNEELAKSVLNTRFGQELKDSINKGYLEVPRIQLPNLGSVFHKVYYPAKLSWNFGFAFLNRTQPYASLPFVGLDAQIAGRLKLYSLLFPWNKNMRDSYVNILEESGYEYGRIVESQVLEKSKVKIGNVVDRTINFLSDVTEFANRMENMFGAEYYLTKQEGKTGVKLSESDKHKVSAAFSGFINFLGGKGYSPLAQRTSGGRFLYTFGQFPAMMLNVYQEMIEISTKDKGASEFWRMISREGITSKEAEEFFAKLPNKSRANFFLIALAIALPVATMYALTRSWNVASRALPGLPRIASSDLLIAIANWQADPSGDTLKKLKDASKQFFSITAVDKVRDFLDMQDYGMIQTKSTGRPIFTGKTINDALRVLMFGRSSLPEYEKQYPSELARIFGGHTENERVQKFVEERAKITAADTQNAVEFMKGLDKYKTREERVAMIKKFKAENKLSKGMLDKLKGYLEDKARGVGGLERSIQNLNNEDQARFILDSLKNAKTVEAKRKLLADYTRQKILTPNIIEAMKKIAVSGQ